jgi:hypothetical protein
MLIEAGVTLERIGGSDERGDASESAGNGLVKFICNKSVINLSCLKPLLAQSLHSMERKAD